MRVRNYSRQRTFVKCASMLSDIYEVIVVKVVLVLGKEIGTGRVYLVYVDRLKNLLLI